MAGPFILHSSSFRVSRRCLKGSDASGENGVFLRATLGKGFYSRAVFVGSCPHHSGRHCAAGGAVGAGQRVAPAASGFSWADLTGGIGARSSCPSSSTARGAASCSIRRNFIRCAHILSPPAATAFPIPSGLPPASPPEADSSAKGHTASLIGGLILPLPLLRLSPRRTATSSAASCSTHLGVPALAPFRDILLRDRCASQTAPAKRPLHSASRCTPRAFAHFLVVEASHRVLAGFPFALAFHWFFK